MSELVEFDLGDGQTIVVEVEMRAGQPGMGRAARRPNGVIDATSRKFDQAIDVVRPVATMLVDKVRTIPQAPDEFSVEFGLRFTVEASVVIATNSAEGNFKISLTWRRDGQGNRP